MTFNNHGELPVRHRLPCDDQPAVRSSTNVDVEMTDIFGSLPDSPTNNITTPPQPQQFSLPLAVRPKNNPLPYHTHPSSTGTHTMPTHSHNPSIHNALPSEQDSQPMQQNNRGKETQLDQDSMCIGLDFGNSKFCSSVSTGPILHNPIAPVHPHLGRGAPTWVASVHSIATELTNQGVHCELRFGQDAREAVRTNVAHSIPLENLKAVLTRFDAAASSINVSNEITDMLRIEEAKQDAWMQQNLGPTAPTTIATRFPGESDFTLITVNTIEDIFRVFLKYTLHDALSNIAPLHKVSKASLFKLLEDGEIRTAVAMPSMLTAERQTWYKTALVDAGWPESIVLLQEAVCAVRSWLEFQSRDLQRNHHQRSEIKNDALICVDVGGFSTDIEVLKVVFESLLRKRHDDEILFPARLMSGRGAPTGSVLLPYILTACIDKCQPAKLLELTNILGGNKDRAREYIAAGLNRSGVIDRIMHDRVAESEVVNLRLQNGFRWKFEVKGKFLHRVRKLWYTEIAGALDQVINDFRAKHGGMMRIIPAGGASISGALRNFLVDRYKGQKDIIVQRSIEAAHGAIASTVSRGCVVTACDPFYRSGSVSAVKYGIDDGFGEYEWIIKEDERFTGKKPLLLHYFKDTDTFLANSDLYVEDNGVIQAVAKLPNLSLSPAEMAMLEGIETDQVAGAIEVHGTIEWSENGDQVLMKLTLPRKGHFGEDAWFDMNSWMRQDPGPDAIVRWFTAPKFAKDTMRVGETLAAVRAAHV